MNKIDENDQYDVSYKFKKLFDLKTQQRNAAKEYYQKLLYNPFRPTNDGVPFDPVLHRYGAMSMYHNEYFKATPKVLAKWCLLVTPFFITYFHHRYTKRKEEETLRSGVVSYADRKYKMVY